MKLSIRNFAKIEDADIVIDGITVIAGENNTGKSTVGKILFAVFNSLSNLDEKILEGRLQEIEQSNEMILRNRLIDTEVPRNRVVRDAFHIAREINTKIRYELDAVGSISDENLFEMIEKKIESFYGTAGKNEYDWTDTIEELCKNTKEVFELSEENIVLEIVSRYFNGVFYEQIQPLTTDENVETVVTLEIKGQKETLLFENNGCNQLLGDIRIMHKAIYIDNPFVIDELSEYSDMNPMNELLVELLTGRSQDGILDGLIETVRAKEKLNDIYEALQNVIDGEIFQSNEEYYLKNKEFKEPISFHNLSTGMKSFLILKMLLENGGLKDKDVIILDEPEIHLHPQWQVVYAELIVLLQKQFDLSVVVTTHSPYFVDALNLFSCKYKTDKKVHYYLSENHGNAVKIECVTQEIDLIYKKMASPIQMLDTLRYELNNN